MKLCILVFIEYEYVCAGFFWVCEDVCALWVNISLATYQFCAVMIIG